MSEWFKIMNINNCFIWSNSVLLIGVCPDATWEQKGLVNIFPRIVKEHQMECLLYNERVFNMQRLIDNIEGSNIDEND